MARILLVDADKEARSSLAVLLRREGHEVELAASAEEAGAVGCASSFDLVVTDSHLPGSSGLDLLQRLGEESPATGVVLLSSHGSIEEAVDAIQAGAQDYLRKPLEDGELLSRLEQALLAGENGPRPCLKSEPRGDLFGAIVGNSREIRELLELVQTVAETDSTVLITGETGTGKELVGRALHAGSRRAGREFCAVNSAAFPEALLESELFGHRRGSFTGAIAHKKGLFEQAHLGTVFLDEVAEMPLSMQAKLLRFLQTGEIRPVGSEQTRCVDVRLVAATNKDLEKEAQAGRFREDLYYRLAVIPVHMPPLRQRSDDVPLLALHFVRQFAGKLDKLVEGIEPRALDRLVSHAWPGNVRELENTIERAVTLCAGKQIGLGDLPARFREQASPQPSDALESLETVERRHILATLDRVGWNRKKAASLLRISTTTLWRRLKDFGVETDVARRPLDGGARPF